MKVAKPNNVGVTYGFQAGNRTVDLVFAACRGDDTLCIFEITPSITLISIPVGIQPTIDFSVYGSCAYCSHISGLQYPFVNSKTSLCLQFPFIPTPTDTLNATPIRSFCARSGNQVEGCATDDENSAASAEEEPYGLQCYGAEPTGSPEGYLVDQVQLSGRPYANAEDVTLIYDPTNSTGYILVSFQGLSAYNVYQRAHPHEYVMTFAITAGGVDGVTNTDGISAVGTALGGVSSRVMVNNDVNEVPDRTVREEAAFELVGLGMFWVLVS